MATQLSVPFAQPKPLSIFEVSTLLKTTLEQGFPEIRFTGEISEVKAGKTGHVYFTIKDDKAQLSGVMWAGTVRTLDFKPQQGLAVECLGRPTLYQPRGSLQIIVHKMVAGGEGLLRKKFLELKAKLEKEGFFHPARKRPLPFLPKAIGIVSSAQGAVIHDMMVKLRERMPHVPVYLIDVKVQGDGSAVEIAAAIQQFSQSNLVDVMIVARGGGSLEDLWSFNEEVVVKAIFASSIPVISGVGHETDVTLCDFVADLRAPTPTAAAELVVPKRADLLRQLLEYERRLRDTDRWLQPLAQRLDDLSSRLERRVEARLEEARLKLSRAGEVLKRLRPIDIISRFQERLSNLHLQLSRNTETNLRNAKHALERISGRLEAISPRQVLSRGYALVESKGKVVLSSEQIEKGDALKVSFANGSATATVESRS